MLKTFLIATLATLASGAASAMPNTEGGHTYTFQGERRGSVAHRARSYPAPSAWTPPERVPTVKVRYVPREQPHKLGGGYSFSSPSFSNPSFSAPSFSNPSFSNPSFSNPSYSNASFSNPSYSAPSSSNPGYSNPSYSTPSYSNPSP